jgi:hypothetical protein
VLVSSETPGRWEQLAQPTIRWDPRVRSLTISATTTDFSTVAVFDDTARFSLTPDPVTRRVGTFFQAVFHVTDAHRARRLPVVPRLRPRLRSEVAAQEPDGHAPGDRDQRRPAGHRAGRRDHRPRRPEGRDPELRHVQRRGCHRERRRRRLSSIFGTLTVTATPGTIAGACP